MEKQAIEQQLQEIQKQFQDIEQKINAIEQVVIDIKEIGTVKKGSETWIPLHNGVFVKAKIENTKEFMVNVGGETAVKKSASETIKALEKQKAELEMYRDQIVEVFGNLINELENKKE